MLKGKRKLDNYLTNWCKANGLDVNCKLGPDFEYNSNTNTVYYSLTIVDKHDKLFYKDVCKDLLKPNVIHNSFLLSFFHEIGHQKTENDFTDEDLANYTKMVDKLENKSDLTAHDYEEYYFNNIEYAATKWGCSYINRNCNKVNKLYNDFLELVNDFYIANEVEINEL